MHMRHRAVAGVALTASVVLIVLAIQQQRIDVPGTLDVAAGDLTQPTVTVEEPPDDSSEGLADPGVPVPDNLVAPQGFPAIKPSSTVAGLPAFTTEDVQSYLAENPPPYWDSSTPRPTIVGVEFLSAGEVERRTGTSTDQPDGAVLCLVTVKGQFIPRLPRGVEATFRPDPNTLQHLVFDARTGNLLMVGFPKPTQ